MTGLSRAAQALAAARLQRRQLAAFPGPLPRSLDEAYAIQDEAIRAMPWPVAGWKVAALPGAEAQALGAERIAGPIFAPNVHAEPARLSLPGHAMRGVEAEFGVRLAITLPPHEWRYSESEVAAAIGSVHPAMEIAGGCLETIATLGVPAVVADFGLNEAFVFGRPIDRWRVEDLAAARIEIGVTGGAASHGRGSDVPGGPLGAVVWLANHLSAQGVGLNAGEWVSTGACGAMREVASDGHAVADFGAFGVVRVTFQPANGERGDQPS